MKLLVALTIGEAFRLGGADVHIQCVKECFR